MNILQTYIPALSKICKDAGDAILDIYKDEDAFGIEMKSDDSPLTKADKLANTIICKGLLEIDPNIPIISEENKEIPYAERKEFSTCWLVDPLDGTKEFIKRNGEFTVNIALLRGNKPVLGFVYKPVDGLLYYGIEGLGSFKVDNDVVTQLHAKRFSLTDANLGVVCSRSHLSPETQTFMDSLNAPSTVSKGSSLKFLVLAEGGAHVYPRLAPTMEWDTGAAQVVLEQAGGSVISQDTLSPVEYNKENLLNPYFIAYGNLQG